jgi:GLPGLI family protein
MKKILTASFVILAGSFVQAQQKEGKVIYERTTQMQVSFAGANEEMQRLIPRSRTDKFELTFGNNLSLWKAVEQDNEEETIGGDGGGIQIRMVAQGANDVLFNNFETGTRVEQRELMDKKFIIDDSIRPLKWKMTGETKSILNHNCMKATTTQVSTRSMMRMENGEMKRSEVSDTATIIAWVAADIPVPAGPAEFQGQLPGLILEMDVSDGRQVYKAITISPKADLAILKGPTGKKHYTPEEFRKERSKMMDEMQRNRGGVVRDIRIN